MLVFPPLHNTAEFKTKTRTITAKAAVEKEEKGLIFDLIFNATLLFKSWHFIRVPMGNGKSIFDYLSVKYGEYSGHIRIYRLEHIQSQPFESYKGTDNAISLKKTS